MQDGRAITWKREESPNAAGQGRRLTTGEGDFKESATESKLPEREKVKRRGKGSPLPRQRGGHCKPRPSQDVRAYELSARSSISLEFIGNDKPRQMIALDRIRLTDRLAFLKITLAINSERFCLFLTFLHEKQKYYVTHSTLF